MEGQSKGMSKGCMVGLIVAGAILLIVVALAITCYTYRDDIARFGVSTIITGLKTEIAKNASGLDSTQVNGFLDAVGEKMKTAKIDDPAMQAMFQKIQGVATSGEMTPANIETVFNAMAEAFPDLAHLKPTLQPAESAWPEESVDTLRPDTAALMDTTGGQ